MAAIARIFTAVCQKITNRGQSIISIAKCNVSVCQFVPSVTLKSVNTRLICLTASKMLKEIHETKEENVTTYEGVLVDSDRKNKVINVDDQHGSCTLCRLNLNLKYTDVLILSQFIRPDGCILPRRVTGVCLRQQRRLLKLINQAQRAGLMPNLRPPNKEGKAKEHLISPYKWKKYNCYFE